MRGFKKDSKGAVTVFVTLLLIPAILISGTAVDLARIYTAGSILSDAGRLAANSVLSQYNALLQDLYGVFGIAENDPILARLLDEYISITVFGEEGRDTDLGTLQLFYGSNLSLDEIYFPDGQNLRNPDVLRRQIEEYMKFRAPVVIVSQLLDMLGENSFREDAGVISDKLEIDEAIAAMHDKYVQLYEAITAADMCVVVPSDPAGAAGDVSLYLKNIRKEFIDLSSCYNAWKDEEDEEKKEDYAAKYRAILANIGTWISGGRIGKVWLNGRWLSGSNVIGLNTSIANAKNRADRFKPKFDEVINIAREIDRMNAELLQKIDDLEQRVLTGQCNDELRAALTTPDLTTGKSVIDTYRDILKWDDIESLAVIYKDGGYHYIDEILKPMLDGATYRNSLHSPYTYIARERFANASSIGSLSLTSGSNRANEFASYSEEVITYKMPAGFMLFGEYPGDNNIFFEELRLMVNGTETTPVSLYEGQSQGSGSNSERRQRNMIDNLTQIANDAYAGLTNNPMGAQYIDGADATGDTQRAVTISEAATTGATHSVSNVISDPFGCLTRAGDYLLLLTYCTSVFSNYTTTRPQSNGFTIENISEIEFPVSVSGVPISPEVNYFFQSEWEYLYNGELNADSNLNSVSRLIYLIRMICNYITVFSVSEITSIVNMIRSSFYWNPPLGIVLGELARAAFVAAESTIDLAKLRAGNKVSLIKSSGSGEWVCSPSGVAGALSDVLSANNSDGDDNEQGLTYAHYMMFFFVAKGAFDPGASAQLTMRTADLIEWNVINYENNIMCDEERMSEALASDGRFRLEDMKTGFSITTTADMSMLFLSMLAAENFGVSRGINMPRTYSISATDYRGY